MNGKVLTVEKGFSLQCCTWKVSRFLSRCSDKCACLNCSWQNYFWNQGFPAVLFFSCRFSVLVWFFPHSFSAQKQFRAQYFLLCVFSHIKYTLQHWLCVFFLITSVQVYFNNCISVSFCSVLGKWLLLHLREIFMSSFIDCQNKWIKSDFFLFIEHIVSLWQRNVCNHVLSLVLVYFLSVSKQVDK